ncbi:MauE/DoxX family redox-associated membrane protein [Pseudonocardia sp. CA-107938]|uniref:MauE/DoxX family redox-associated membrane protein n=1 Tax=Pseudonocardia sp. CA-107938 TaxID=3240021 RepID=UPI003D946E1D
MTRVLATLARLLLGGVWLWAGFAKVVDLDASVRAVRAYELLPEPVVPAIGAALPLVEILLGLLLVVGAFVRPAAAVSAVLMAAFVIGIASAWARGLRIDCGCFGSGGLLAADEEPTYGWELARDGGLLLVALLLARWPASRFALDGLFGRRPVDERVRRPAGVGTE